MKTNFFRQSFALLAGVVLLVNVFLPSVVVFAEEEVPSSIVEPLVQESSSVEGGGELSKDSASDVFVPQETEKVETQERSAEEKNQILESSTSPVIQSEEKSESTPVVESVTPVERPVVESTSGASAPVPVSTSVSEPTPSEGEAVVTPVFHLEEAGVSLRRMPMRAPVQADEVEMFFSSKNVLHIAGVLTEDKKHLDVDATLLAIENNPALVEQLKAEHPMGAFITLDYAKESLKAALNNYTPSNHEIFEIDGKLVLFLKTKNGGAAQVFVNQKASNLQNAFTKGESDRTQVLWQVDMSKKVAPYGNSSTFRTSSDAGYKPGMDKYNPIVSDGNVIGYTIKTDDYYWFYAPVYPTKTFYTSKGTSFDVILDENGAVNLEKNKELVEKKYAGNQLLIDTVKATQKAEILTINDVEVLFVEMADGQTKAFWAKQNYNQLAFNNKNDADPTNPQVSNPIVGSSIVYDLDRAIAPSWVHPQQVPISLYNEVKNAEEKVIGYTLYDPEGRDWFYAPAVEVTTTSFYTSNDREVKVVLNDDATINLDLTKKVLYAQFVQLTNEEERLKAQALLAALQPGVESRVEIKTINDELGKLMFVKWDDHTTKVFRSKLTSPFKNAFKSTLAHQGDPLDADIANAIAPSWITDAEKSDLTHYVEIGTNAYTLLTDSGHWFYAPKKEFEQTPFYTSNNRPIFVVLKDATTLNFPVTRKFLGTQIPLIPESLKEGNTPLREIAQKFYDTATANDVEIKELEGVKILFVNLGTSTKAFAGTASSIFQNAFKDGLVFDANTVVYDTTKIQAPHWVDLTKSVVKYNKVEKNGTLIGYVLKNADNDWFYAPKKVIASGGGSSGGGSSSSSSSRSSSSSSPTLQPKAPVEELVFSGEITTPLCSVAGSTFSTEQNDAYLWACEKDITTMRTISGAKLDQSLTRAQLAKMMSVYVTKILGKSPVLTGTVVYGDVDAKQLGDLADYIQLAYQLQIMGIHADGTPLANFDPHKVVTRAEFATVFSRVLYGLKYNRDGNDWYQGHLEALQAAKVLENITPMLQELRGWVLLMMFRSQKSW